MKAPLYVLEDENGDLFLAGEATCRESTAPVMLEDVKLWDAYVESCMARSKASRAVMNALKVPSGKRTR